jgi:hypothetical protein
VIPASPTGYRGGPMADREIPRSPEALRLGGLLDVHHPASDIVRPSPMGTCDVCGSLMYSPTDEGLKHLPSEGEFLRVKKWLKDRQVGERFPHNRA